MKEEKVSFVEKTRWFRSKKFNTFGKFCLKAGLTADRATFLSFIAGLLTVYFLFTNDILFVVFGLSHLLFDGLDGVIARASKTTNFGRYFDHLTDRCISLFLLLRLGFYLQDYYVFIIAAIFVLTQAIHLISKFKYPVVFIRTTAIIVLFFSIILPDSILTIGYLTAGGASLYSLVLQLQFLLKKQQEKSIKD